MRVAKVRVFVRCSQPEPPKPLPEGMARPRLLYAPTKRPRPGRYWDDHSFQYLTALALAGLPVIAVSSHGLVDLGSPGSRWHGVSGLFSGVMDDRWINVVVGDDGDVTRLFTVGARANIAVTGVYPNPPNPVEQLALRRYDYVAAVDNESAAALRALGIDATFQAPTELAALVKRMLETGGDDDRTGR